MKVPKLNKRYNCFVDGKIRESRRYFVDVKEVISFDKIDNKTLSIWESEVKTYHWLYRDNTDFFIKTYNGDSEEEIFVRTKDNGWFSMGWLGSGRLDIDGTLTKSLERN